jgi:DNA-binding IclR family transcriptional regulator
MKANKNKHTNSQYHIASVVKAAKVLNSFLLDEEGLTIPQIAKLCGITQGTAYRFVFTLRFCGFIEEDQKTGTFRLGKALFPLANKALNQDTFLRFARPEIQALSEETRCNSSMGVLFHGSVLYVARVDSQGSRNTYAMLGRMTPTHCTALGKVLISELSKKKLRRLY